MIVLNDQFTILFVPVVVLGGVGVVTLLLLREVENLLFLFKAGRFDLLDWTFELETGASPVK